MIWRCRDLAFDLSRRVLVMGVVNVTPDSFSDGGRTLAPADAIAHAHRLVGEGAEVIDLGAESTRPGAEPVAPAEQWRRLSPVLEALVRDPAICVSIDTSSAEVAERALAIGARVINDVTALADPAMGRLIAGANAGVVLMHMQGSPATMQQSPHYEDASREVGAWLAARIDRALSDGVPAEAIAVDPGIGFGKDLTHNLELIARIDELASLGRPIVIGVSRKRFIGRLLDADVDQRLEGSLVAASVAVFQGAAIVRAHDVQSTLRAVGIARALREARANRAAIGA